MKKTIITFFGLTMILSAHAQIPNSGFESWVDMGNYDNPEGWATLNSLTDVMNIYTCVMGTPGSPGQSFLKLTSKAVTGLGVIPGVATCGELDIASQEPVSGIPFTERPESFNGKWQHMIFGNSQGSIEVTLTKWNSTTQMREIVANAHETLSGMAMSWANFSIDFDYLSGGYPDSCLIYMSASGGVPTNNDYLWVDNLSFQGSVLEVQAIELATLSFEVFPNPSTDFVHAIIHSPQSQIITIQLTDILGNISIDIKADVRSGATNIRLETGHLGPGMYNMNIISSLGIRTEKILVQ